MSVPILAQAKNALTELHSHTVGLKDGVVPNPMLLMGIQADIVRLYAAIGEEMALIFGQKERAYLQRKVEQAKQHAKGRLRNMTSKDAEENAFMEAEEKYRSEIAAMETYELYRVFQKSLQNGLEHCRSVVSFIKTAEQLPQKQ